jgi:alpha-beta hydrolase superfamily lysophospholipase
MTTSSTAASTVRSADGTSIAFERAGAGPALVLVDAAGHYRDFSSFTGLVGLLATEFTVYQYDRRGRGASGDLPPYAVEREIEDLAAVIGAAGGSAFLYTFSSGGLLGLHAAAAGLPITRMALLEPPIEAAEDRTVQAAFTAELVRLVEGGRPEAAVEHFLTSIGVPEDVLAGMRSTPAWAAMVSVAHTLVYDARLSEASSPQLLASVTVPTLVLDSEGSSDDLTGMAATVAAGLPRGEHRSLAGDWHGVADEVVAPVLVEFFRR